jgi:transcriptional regulator of acetoin/glycerol metabolism
MPVSTIQSAISSNGAALPERLKDSKFRRARQEVEPLIQVAQRSLDRIYNSLGGVGCCVLLADRSGVPVERRGAPGDDATFFDWGLWPGVIWSEDSEGTTGVGMCLAEQRALTIHRGQHFYARNALLSCTTAPICDHQGRLVAALDVSSCRPELIENFVSLIATAVSDAAARIEAECFRLAYPDARTLVIPVSDKMGRALMATDQDDLVVGPPARRVWQLKFPRPACRDRCPRRK